MKVEVIISDDGRNRAETYIRILNKEGKLSTEDFIKALSAIMKVAERCVERLARLVERSKEPDTMERYVSDVYEQVTARIMKIITQQAQTPTAQPAQAPPTPPELKPEDFQGDDDASKQ